MAEADWDEVTYLRKKPQRAADARSQRVLKIALCMMMYMNAFLMLYLGRKSSSKERSRY